MAQQILLVDDIDQSSEAAETVHFSYRGKDYEIDLNANNAKALDNALRPYLVHARKAGKHRATIRQAVVAAKADTSERAEWSDPAGATYNDRLAYREMRTEARQWALANGWPDLGGRGRVPTEAFAAWKEHQRWTGDLFAAWQSSRDAHAATPQRTKSQGRIRAGANRSGQLATV